MKAPTAESSFKLAQAVRALLKSDELMSGDVAERTHALIEEVLETVGQVERECQFPDRPEILAFFAQRFAAEEKDRLVQRIVALVGTLSNEELYSSFEAVQERDRSRLGDEM